ncbi:MAG: lipase maturation factor family protein, partial [Candidatus Margulisbacteria bacterium]|nr:lipase maturation factor family protein [Candidatus Margulisiibacteriota bacterium]
LEYEFKAKPGDVNRCPPVISPYHYRLDWQIWFAAMGSYQQHPWLLHLIYKLLQNDTDILRLIYHNPFTEGPPQFIRIELYEYRFPHPKEKTKRWWNRKRISSYLPPLHIQDPGLRKFLKNYGWL